MTQRFPLALRRLVGSRGRTILHASGWSLIAKAAAAANLFVAVPFVMKSIGPVQFGVWATLVSFATFSAFLDFGLGNGAMNLVAAAHGRGDTQEVSIVWRQASWLLCRTAGVIALVALAALPWVPWHAVLGMPAAQESLARYSVAVVVIAIALSIPLNLSTRIQLALGRGDIAFRWQAFGQITALLLVLLLANSHAGLVALTGAAIVTPLLGSLANTLNLLRNREVRRSSPMAGGLDRNVRKRIRDEGLLFFYLQLAAALSFTLDLPLISAIRGAEEAGTYAVAQRLFSIVSLSLALVWSPLWPVYRHALASGHHDWIRKTLRRTTLFAGTFATCGALFLCVGFDSITRLWLHRDLAVSSVLVAGLAAWCVTEATGTAVATFLNAASIMRYQVIVATFFALACVSGKAWVLQHHGMEWVPWVTLASYLCCFIIPTIISLPRLIDGALSRRY